MKDFKWFDVISKLQDEDVVDAGAIYDFLTPLLSAEIEADVVPVDDVIEMAKNYFEVTISAKMVKELFKDNINLAHEAYVGGVTDTCVRDEFIEALLNKMGMPQWPTYGDTDQYQNEFFGTVLPKLQDNLTKGVWK